MATISTNTYVNYAGGTAGASSVVGYANGVNRVVRFQFTTPSTGASSVSIKGNLSFAAGTVCPPRWYITTSDASHVNAGGDSTYHGTLSCNIVSGVYECTGSADILLLPNTTYYLYLFPPDTTYGYWGHYESWTITTNGGAGLVYIYNGSSWDAYQCYIYNGSGWDLYMPYIYNGSDWDLYT